MVAALRASIKATSCGVVTITAQNVAATQVTLGSLTPPYRPAGIVSVAAHWAGVEFAGIVRSVQRGAWEQARALNERVAPSCAFESTEQYPNPMPSKAAMRALGFAVGQCRLPHGPSDVALDLAAADVIALLRGARG